MIKPMDGHRVLATVSKPNVWVTVQEACAGEIQIAFPSGYSHATLTLAEAELHMNQMRRLIDRQKARANA